MQVALALARALGMTIQELSGRDGEQAALAYELAFIPLAAE